MSRHDPVQARYDETPYRDHVFPQFDLSRLLGLARLFGLGPDSNEASSLRVLDLGCASGRHIRTQAEMYPGARFSGIDFSAHELDVGRRAISDHGLANVELLEADLRTVEIEPGAFDLILCYGIFSWVPDDVKHRILQLFRTGLKRSGVAAIAYITYPGWKQREAIRELLAMRVAGVTDPAERIRESALMLRFLHATYSASTGGPMAEALKEIVEGMQKSSANVFLHDELSENHDPCYFLQFVEWAAECELQYLAETELCTMSMGELPAEAQPLLQELAPDFLETQQWIDFLVHRAGRCSLLAREDATITRQLERESLRDLSFVLSAPAVDVPEKDGAFSLENSRGVSGTFEDPVTKQVIERLRSAAPEPVSFENLGTKDESGKVISNHPALTDALLYLVGQSFVDPMLPIAEISNG